VLGYRIGLLFQWLVTAFDVRTHTLF
jgi:hypothetical protein